ncbi:MAG: ABC transporter ATP-binding protein, partial [Acidobacteria bacterium]|nr:ABC transporter ATP-binding protein [Acidobacteriota bacterium]
MRRLIAYARPYAGTLFLAVVLMSFVGASQALMARLIVPLFDLVLQPQAARKPVVLFEFGGFRLLLSDLLPSGVEDVWTAVAIGIVGAFLIKGLADYAANYLINDAGYGAVTDIRQQVYDKVLRQDTAFFQENSTGALMSSIMSDIEKIQVAVSHLLADWFRQTFTVIALLAVVLQTNAKFAIVALTVLPFVLVPTARLGRRIRRTTRKGQDYAAELNQILQETITGHQIVKTFGTEEIESNRFREASKRLRRNNVKYVAQQAIASPLIEFFAALTIVGLLTFAQTEIRAGKMTAGDFTSFIVALLLLYEPVKRLTGIHNIFQQALGASQKVFEYLDREQAVQDRPGAVKLDGLTQSIRFEDVTFRYPAEQDRYALQGINLTVPAGKVA